MPFCKHCGKEIPDDSNFCKHCGGNLAAKPPAEALLQVTEEDFSNFVGRNSQRYLPKFRKFIFGGVHRFAMTWNWPAFLITFWWFWYRKLYGWGFASFLLGLIFSPLANLVFGITANFIYFRHAKKSIIGYKSANPNVDFSKVAADLQRMGGIHRHIATLAVVVSLAAAAGIGIPGYYYVQHSRVSACNAAAKANLVEAVKAHKAYERTRDIRANTVELLSLSHPEDIVIEIVTPGLPLYMIAYHKKGTKLYTWWFHRDQIDESERIAEGDED